MKLTFEKCEDTGDYNILYGEEFKGTLETDPWALDTEEYFLATDGEQLTLSQLKEVVQFMEELNVNSK